MGGWRALLKPTLHWCWGSGVWEADTIKRVLGSWLCMKPSPKTLGTCTKISSLLSLILILFIWLCFKTVFLSCWMLACCLAYPSGCGEGEYSLQRLILKADTDTRNQHTVKYSLLQGRERKDLAGNHKQGCGSRLYFCLVVWSQASSGPPVPHLKNVDYERGSKVPNACCRNKCSRR